MSKRAMYLFAILILVILIVPSVLVTISHEQPINANTDKVTKKNITNSPLIVKVYLTRDKRVLALPLEDYVKGVVASEVPASFHEEALKAQALAARTYVYSRLKNNSLLDTAIWGSKAEGAHVSDTVSHQVYSTDQVLESRWKGDYQDNLNRIKAAVQATEGKILTYNKKPIYAAFFSTSNGRTENSEDYYQKKYPYLRSVSSEWDRRSPEYQNSLSIPITDMIKKLKNNTHREVALEASTSSLPMIQVLKRTEGNRVHKVRVGDQVFTGRQIREAAGLPSSDFICKVDKDKILFTTFGYGHGVGMSQWGANLMARAGKSATEIVQHYYSKVEITSL